MNISRWSFLCLVVVKLDIDSPETELLLAKELIHNKRLSKLVDVFYFEHHVHIEEMEQTWEDSMHNTVEYSMDLFTTLRQQGIDAHYWV